MNSITVHNIADDVYSWLVDLADKKGASLNATIKDILHEKAGVSKSKKKRDLSKFVGMWTKEETEEFDRAISETEKIYPGEW